jgi:hypothetical protein
LARLVDVTDFRLSRRGCGTGGTVLGVQSHRCMRTSWRGLWAPQIFWQRETVLGLCRWPRTVCKSVGGRLRDGAGRLPTLCFQSHRCMVTSWRGPGGGRDRFCHRDREMVTVKMVLQLSHRLRECRRGMARRRRPFAGLWFAHVYVMCVWFCELDCGGRGGLRAATVECRVNAIAICVEAWSGC